MPRPSSSLPKGHGEGTTNSVFFSPVIPTEAEGSRRYERALPLAKVCADSQLRESPHRPPRAQLPRLRGSATRMRLRRASFPRFFLNSPSRAQAPISEAPAIARRLRQHLPPRGVRGSGIPCDARTTCSRSGPPSPKASEGPSAKALAAEDGPRRLCCLSV